MTTSDYKPPSYCFKCVFPSSRIPGLMLLRGVRCPNVTDLGKKRNPLGGAFAYIALRQLSSPRCWLLNPLVYVITCFSVPIQPEKLWGTIDKVVGQFCVSGFECRKNHHFFHLSNTFPDRWAHRCLYAMHRSGHRVPNGRRYSQGSQKRD